MGENERAGENDLTGVLTADERDALRVAVERGCFQVPRAKSLKEVAHGLDRAAVDASRRSRREIDAALQATEAPDAPATNDVLDSPLAATDGTGTSDALDRLFDALSHPYRRRILLLLSEQHPRDADELSVEAVATEDEDLEALTTVLYHDHLPKLAESGYVEWDTELETIRRGPNFEAVAPLLQLVDGHQDELPDGWP